MHPSLTLVSYWYEGDCPQTGQRLRLPRTVEAETIARQLMQELARDEQSTCEGKMYGILLVETPAGTQQVLKAFSGLLNGESGVAGWVPPIPGREQVVQLETQTLACLAAIKQELIALKQIPERQRYQTLAQAYEQRLQQLALDHQQRQQARQQQRQRLQESLSEADRAIALEQLDDQSRRDGMERRQLKRERNAALQPLKQTIDQADARLRELKQQRKALSQQLQAQMHASYWLTNFAGSSRSLQQLILGGTMPTGTGDCCAPKLLHYAATHGLKPLAMAEFWWGPASPNGDKVQGEFYGACTDRCQPLMGFLLSGLSERLDRELPIVYEDAWLLVVNKPAGLLSVPGRTLDRQDSVLSRLQQGQEFLAVHRLDQDTSGLLVLARNPDSHRQLSQQFEERQVHKVYEAVLAGGLTEKQGVIDLPLWGDPSDRPYQKVDWQRGKPSVTHYQVLSQAADRTRVELHPLTGRTHQLRVHAADPQGLGMPILGDRLYGSASESDRLHLHARELRFQHPQSGRRLELQTETPF